MMDLLQGSLQQVLLFVSQSDIMSQKGERSMNILSIGNSFSQDAQRYLHRIAAADGVKLNSFNLMIGGCTLSTHYRNMLSGNAAYTLEMNGVSTGFKVSLEEALLNRDWDVVTIQQASPKSPKYETYQPYLNELAEYVRTCVPQAKLAIHQTWAYEETSPRLTEMMGYATHGDMFKDIEKANEKAYKDAEADLLIPSGKVFSALSGKEKIHRDTFHASLGLGRYALGLTWYKALTGNDVMNNSFRDFDEEVTAEQIALVKKTVEEVVK